MMKKWHGLTLAVVLGTLAAARLNAQTAKRLLTLDDLSAVREVRDPRMSPEGDWVAYTVRTSDLEEDRKTADIWMTRWDGSRSIRLTSSKESEHSPRWSPDGQYLAFLSSRGVEGETDQVWLMNRAGGEADRLTELKGGVSDLAWSPDSKRLALVALDPDPDAAEEKRGDKKKKTSRPLVIDRFQFKEDVTGYMAKRRQHLYLLDLGSRRVEILTPGAFDEHLPSWSPDGSAIAFVSKRGADLDRHDNYDLYLIEPRPGATARPITSSPGADGDPTWGSRPAWSPDGKWIAYVQGGPPEWVYYAVPQLAIVSPAGGPPQLPAPGIDRFLTHPRWSEDGQSVFFLLEEDRRRVLARVSAMGGKVQGVADGRGEIDRFDLGPGDKIAVLESQPDHPSEVYALDGAEPRPLSRQNEPLLERLRLGAVEEISFKSNDGTLIHGFVVKPPDYQPGRKYPTILSLHGGPVGQFSNEFMFDWQLFAASGYVVVAANPRGSSGRGQEFTRAIWADWGNKDGQDVLAAVDYVVAQGFADPERLGVGGWSYGGMLTNYAIAQDTRFKAAVSGASISNILAGYGTDQYIRVYEAELGRPWENPDAWLRVSFPFLHADRIVTPTLFLCGEKDFNVPLLNSEQMYQALRSLGRDTQLIIYPGQYHGLTTPSYLRDRLERYLAWYGKYLKPEVTSGRPTPSERDD